MARTIILSIAVAVMFAGSCAAQGHLWTYSNASPTGNAYEYNAYGAFPVYPLGAWRVVGPYYDDCCCDRYDYFYDDYLYMPARRYYLR